MRASPRYFKEIKAALEYAFYVEWAEAPDLSTPKSSDCDLALNQDSAHRTSYNGGILAPTVQVPRMQGEGGSGMTHSRK